MEEVVTVFEILKLGELKTDRTEKQDSRKVSRNYLHGHSSYGTWSLIFRKFV